jgi:hypothetical protein
MKKVKVEDVNWDELPFKVQQSILRAEKELDEGKGVAHEKYFKKFPPAPSKNKPYK